MIFFLCQTFRDIFFCESSSKIESFSIHFCRLRVLLTRNIWKSIFLHSVNGRHNSIVSSGLSTVTKYRSFAEILKQKKLENWAIFWYFDLFSWDLVLCRKIWVLKRLRHFIGKTTGKISYAVFYEFREFFARFFGERTWFLCYFDTLNFFVVIL